MFRYSSTFFSRWLLCLTMFGSAASMATEYTINTTNDVVGADGFCSLREAVQAITTQVAVHECAAGTGGDVVFLKEGATYQLTAGELVLGGGTKQEPGPEPDDPPVDVPINPTVVFRVPQENPFDDDIKINPVVIAAPSDRVLHLKEKAIFNLRNITFRGNGAVADNGGLILAEGNITLETHASMEDGHAQNGGAIYVSGTAVLNLRDTAFINNQAMNGGAIATSGTSSGGVLGATLYFANNVATNEGGAIFLDGSSPALQLVNSTFFGNAASGSTVAGGAIRLAAGTRTTLINNATLAGQDGGAAISFGAQVGSVSDYLLNSVIVGNTDGSCVGDAAAIDAAEIHYVVHQGGDCVLDGELPGNNSGAADYSVLEGVSGDCPAGGGTGVTVCAPQEFDSGWFGFMPSLTAVAPSIIDAGSPLTATSNVCSSLDQRGADREDRCDAGATELRIAKGKTDEFRVVSGRLSNPLDVAANDSEDLEIDCAGIVDCMVIDILPRKGTATVELTVDPLTGREYPQIRYQSFPGIHGVDTLHYVIKKSAVPGERTYANLDIGAQVNLVVEPASGLSESEDIDDLGSGPVGLMGLGLLMLAGIFRRFRRVLVAVLLGGSCVAQAADIQVNLMLDDPTFNDGWCTLREAIGNSIDEAPLVSPDCARGATGRDRILLPEGTLTLNDTLTIVESSVEIEGVGAAVGTVVGTTLEGDGTFPLIAAQSSLRLRYLTIQGGGNPDKGGAVVTNAGLTLDHVVVQNNTANSGGAVYLNYNSDERRTVRFIRSHFENNSATLDGGVVSMTGQNQSHEITIESSSFLGNSAGGAGGALDINLPVGGRLRIANSTFYANSAANGDAIDLGDLSASAYIMNSTFVNHGAAVDLRDLPDSANVRLHNSIYLNSGSCSTGTGRFYTSSFNVFSPSADATCVAITDSDNQAYAAADIEAIIGSTPVQEDGEAEDFVPAHFPIDPTAANSTYLMDAGNGSGDDLVRDYDSPSVCRATDLRNRSRNSGNRCDIGAYELQKPTAADDSDDNIQEREKYVIIDVLENDLDGERGQILTQTIDLDTASVLVDGSAATTNGGTARVVQRDDIDADCGGEPGTVAQDCVVRYDPPGGLDCTALETFSDSFPYRFQIDVDEEPSAPGPYELAETGTVTVDIRNVPPRAKNVVRRAKLGETVVFPFVVTDPDAATPTVPVLTDFTLTVEPINARSITFDGERVYHGVVGEDDVRDLGVIIDLTAQTVTYRPANISSPFDDTFVLSYKDECGGSGSTRFTVDLPQESNSGDFVGGGSASWAFLLALMLGLPTRRRERRCCL